MKNSSQGFAMKMDFVNAQARLSTPLSYRFLNLIAFVSSYFIQTTVEVK